MSAFAAAALVVMGAVHGPTSAQTLRRLEIDRGSSYIAVKTGTAGLLGFLGHEHGIVATEWSASICADAERPEALRGSITVPVESLRIDTAPALAAVGIDRGVDEEQRDELQTKMTSPRFLAAAKHPEIRFEVASVEMHDRGSGTLRGELTLRGTTRRVSAPFTLSQPDPSRGIVEGSFRVRQTDHGIEPESIAGVVKVADAVEVKFRIVAAIGSPCPRRTEARAGGVAARR